MSNDIIIRQETVKDFDQIRTVIESAFRNMEESDHTEHILVEKLRESDAYIPELSLVAETGNNQIIGHILLSKVKIVNENNSYTALALAPLSVLPSHQRMGIGGMLIKEAHRRAAKLGYAATVLLGHKDYYPKFGYPKASVFGIKIPFNVPDENCMVVE